MPLLDETNLGGGGLLGIYRIPRFDKRNYVVCQFALVHIVEVISFFFLEKNTNKMQQYNISLSKQHESNSNLK